MARDRVGILLNPDVNAKLQQMADSYGMSKNALMTFILGTWVDTNFGMKEKLTGKLLDLVKEQLQEEEK